MLCRATFFFAFFFLFVCPVIRVITVTVLDRVGGNPSHWLTRDQWGRARVREVDTAEPSFQHTTRPAVRMHNVQ